MYGAMPMRMMREELLNEFRCGLCIWPYVTWKEQKWEVERALERKIIQFAGIRLMGLDTAAIEEH